MPGTDQKFEADKRLAGVLRHYYCVRTPADGQPVIQHFSPSLEMAVIFSFGATVPFSFGSEKIGTRSIQRITMLGPLKQMLNYEIQPGTDLFILAFRFDGFYRFQSLPGMNQDLLAAAPDEIIRSSETLDHIWEILAPLTDNADRVKIIQNYLLENIGSADAAAQSLVDNENALYDPALKPVAVMAQNAAVSDRTIQKRFKKYVGYSPKELLRFLRFKAVVHYLLENPSKKTDWFEIIHTYNYHDQSHLIKDFKYFTGVTPKQFLKIQNDGSVCMHD